MKFSKNCKMSSHKDEYYGFKLHFFPPNCDACMSGIFCNVRKVAGWLLTPAWFKFYMDQVARGKLKPDGIGEVLFQDKGECLLVFSGMIGIEELSYGLFEKLLVFSDSFPRKLLV